jgi:hypothetical protein
MWIAQEPEVRNIPVLGDLKSGIPAAVLTPNQEG